MNLSKNRRIAFALAAGVLLALATMVVAFQPGRAAGPWYVTPGGDDENDCLSPATPCASINGAIGKAGAGDMIYVASGTYTGTGDQVVLLDKDATLSGGWDQTFTTQDGTSTIDGEGARRGMTVNRDVTAAAECFIVQSSSTGVENMGGTLALSNVIVSGNGWGIMNGGTITATSTSVSRNDGRGIHNSGTILLDHSTVSEHASLGIYSSGVLTLNNSTVRDNMACGIQNEGIMTVNGSTISGNATGAYGEGGGIFDSGTLTLNNSTLSGNMADSNGGGIRTSGTVTLNNCTISGNTANGDGGGFMIDYGTLYLNNTTVSDNRANGDGGGIYNRGGRVTLQNAILAGNIALGSGPECHGYATTTIGSSGYNLVGDISDCALTPAAGDLIGVDPNLGELIASPGTPVYWPLLFGSPAIDAGNPTGCTDDQGSPLDTDQRGAARVGRCDIGAYEYTSPGPAASVYAFGGTPQSTLLSVAFRMPLQAAVLDSIGSPVDSASVTFSAPASGASGIFADSGSSTTTAMTNESGIASAATFTANGLAGSYEVQATVGGVVTPADFLLDNNEPCCVVCLPYIARNFCPSFLDDFGNPASGWAVVDDSYVRTEYLDGEYRVLTKQSGYFYLFKAPTCDRRNYTVEVDARWVGPPGRGYGLIFGVTGGYVQYYLLDVNTDDQQFQLLRRDPSGFVMVVPTAYTPAINGGSYSNHLKVTRNGDGITLEVNGILLGTWYDGTIGGLTGAGVVTNPYSTTPTSDARFDNFSIATLLGGDVSLPQSDSATPDEIEFVAPNARRDPAPADVAW